MGVIQGDCIDILPTLEREVALTFFDPPFNQGKDYVWFSDNKSDVGYWQWVRKVCKLIRSITLEGGAIFFMQREKNLHRVIEVLHAAGWNCRNVIIWKKFQPPAPLGSNFGLQYQVIVYAIKGDSPRVFNTLRMDYPLLAHQKYERPKGLIVNNVWDDIRELSAGFLSGSEAFRDEKGERVHLQQSPIHLLLRIILSSTNIDDLVLDPTCGSGTTLITAKQLRRRYVGIEIDPNHVVLSESRLDSMREEDDIKQFYNYYRFTEDLEQIWGWKPDESDMRRYF
jgi:DNA modification methylase